MNSAATASAAASGAISTGTASTGSPPISVLIVDDHGVVREGLRAWLATQADLNVAGAAGDAETAESLCTELAPDVALVDLLMPGADGIETTRRIKAVSPRTQVIILTSSSDDAGALPALRAGAVSYLLKDVGADELADAVRKAARGEAVLHPRIAARLVEALRPQPKATPQPEARLSQREREVLQLIAQGLSNAQIATQLSIGEKTVKSHVSNVLDKLHLADRTQAAVFAWRNGLIRQD